jgi:hypothetical protein
MFDLEKSIIAWHRQMLAAGIKASALHELEIHLREEMEKQQQTGLDEAAAFEAAIQNIGKPAALTDEFKKLGRRTLTTDRVLGLLWFIYCAGSFYTLSGGLFNTASLTKPAVYFPHFQFNALFLLAVLMDVIYLRGLIASVLLFGGQVRERRFIFFLAILDAIGGVVVLSTRSFHFLPCLFTIVGFITLIAYWPRPNLKSAVE